MKVLFAVNNDNISDAIVKKYQKEYRQILSYKNVYYFNAILKELQKDRTYDRVVISEDLEPFANNNYDTIDKFLFDKLDNISDEANGENTEIILICADRRGKTDDMLVKLFGIGVYSAILGQDRSVDEVCKLINKPRTKKEAKGYYKIESDNVSYQSENENNVSEAEVQNILAHYKRLGKNEDKYVDSFNNIVSQYTDVQLKIIIRYLPMNVKAVLEERSPKYQELVTFTKDPKAKPEKAVVEKTMKQKSEDYKTVKKAEEPVKIDFVEKKLSDSAITEPIIIPSGVNNVGVRKVIQEDAASEGNMSDILATLDEPDEIEDTVVEEAPYSDLDAQLADEEELEPMTMNTPTETTSNPVAPTIVEEEVASPVMNTPIAPVTVAPPIAPTIVNEPVGPNIVSTPDVMSVPVEPVKRGRGRPRKIVPPGVETSPQAKRGRGRPRKFVSQEGQPVQEAQPNIEQVEEIDDILNGVGVVETSEAVTGVDGIDVLGTFDDVEPVSTATTEDVLGFNDVEPVNVAATEDVLGFNDVEPMDTATPVDVLGTFDDVEPMDTATPVEILEEPSVTQESVNLFGLDEEEPTPVATEVTEAVEEPAELSNDFEEIATDFDKEVGPATDDPIDLFGLEEDAEEETMQKATNQEDSVNLFGIDGDAKQDPYASNEMTSASHTSANSLNRVLTKDKKVVAFIGTTKNGTSFVVNNVAELLSGMGISTAILDMTKSKNAYYIYTNNEEALRQTAADSISKLKGGVADGIKVHKGLSVYTSMPGEERDYSNADSILGTLVKEHSLVLIDCDFDTDIEYFESAQEIYLVQSMDVLTIQPLTAFLRNLKSKNILKQEKVKIVVNKEQKVKNLSTKTLIGGMAFYNDPGMSYMTELFDKSATPYCAIPFELQTYVKYLEGLVNCEISLNGYSKAFMSALNELGSMVYPLIGRNEYSPRGKQKSNFSSGMNDTLGKMKNYQ